MNRSRLLAPLLIPLLAALPIPLPAHAEAPLRPIELYGRVDVKEKACSICIDCRGFSSGTRKTISCHPSLLDGVKVRVSARPEMTGSVCGLEIVGKPEILPPEFLLPTYPDFRELARTLECRPPKK